METLEEKKDMLVRLETERLDGGLFLKASIAKLKREIEEELEEGDE